MGGQTSSLLVVQDVCLCGLETFWYGSVDLYMVTYLHMVYETTDFAAVSNDEK